MKNTQVRATFITDAGRSVPEIEERINKGSSAGSRRGRWQQFIKGARSDSLVPPYIGDQSALNMQGPRQRGEREALEKLL